MATFKAVVQKQRQDGFYPVYIRVTHNRKQGYIKTSKVVDKKSLSKSKDIRDVTVMTYCESLIQEYNRRLNAQYIDQWALKEVISFLTTQENDANFSDYAKLHISRMVNRGQERNAKNYKLAVAHLERYLGTNQILFSYLTSNALRKWIESMDLTSVS